MLYCSQMFAPLRMIELLSRDKELIRRRFGTGEQFRALRLRVFAPPQKSLKSS
jgi:hypothetical protein